MIKTAIYDTQNLIQETFLHPMVEPEKPRGNQKGTPKETNAPRALPAAAFSTGGNKGLAAMSKKRKTKKLCTAA